VEMAKVVVSNLTEREAQSSLSLERSTSSAVQKDAAKITMKLVNKMVFELVQGFSKL